MLISLSQSFSVISSIGLGLKTAALLTRISTTPILLFTFFTNNSISLIFSKLQRKEKTSPPKFLISSTTFFAFFRFELFTMITEDNNPQG